MKVRNDLQEIRWPYFVEGIFAIVLGAIAIVVPEIFSLALEQFLGWLFLFLVLVQSVRMIKTYRSPYFFIELLTSLLYLLIAIFLIMYPIPGILSLALAITTFFTLDGAIRIVTAVYVYPNKRWYWLLLSGLASWILVLIVTASWSKAAYSVLGILCGISLISYGVPEVVYVISNWATARKPG
ncbi:MAG TPA: DUF308 domain-containing protein [Candidatus Babeliaceae bacterium]|nr:DUF308 domain-containing protein [Candidatus Babeliaceae bacterium]